MSWVDLLEATIEKEAPVELAVYMRAGLRDIPLEVKASGISVELVWQVIM